MTIGTSHRALRELVADELRDMILRGDLAPGERLLADQLADRLAVSRNPVRDAIRALQHTGLVELVPRRGAYVSKLDPDEAHQLVELRIVIEAYASALAAARRTDEDLAVLRKCIETGRAAGAANDLIRAATAHRDFHRAVERASGNRYLEAVVAPLRQQTELVFSLLVDSRGVTSWEEHEKILDAIEARDPELARACTAHHMTAVLNDLILRGGAAPVPSA